MCGIVSAISRNNVVPFLLDGLHRLEYRGYDSAGIAVINDRLQRVRAVGRVVELEKQVGTEALAGDIGIAHTRWATHGVPSERNAHPHVSAGVSVVHNGIIENFEAVRATLAGRGYRFLSDTDTEVIAHLVHWHLQTAADLATAVRRAMAELVGAYAIAVISDGSPTRLVVARHGAPLLLGIGEGEQFAASDAAALIRRTNRIVHLEDGDCAELTLDGIRITDAAGNPVTRPEHLSQLGAAAVERGAYHHYMQKEIFEQPAALAKTLEMVSHASTLSPGLFGAAAAPLLERTTEVTIVACGTSYHAGMTARYWIELLAGIPCTVEIASEYRYREAPGNAGKLLVCISQSGETADTIAALKYAQSLPHCGSLSVCNVPESTLARAADLCFLTRAGPEIGVASTKAFTTQLAALLLFSAVVAKLRGRLPAAEETALLAALRSLPAAVGAALRLEAPIKAWAQRLAHSEHALFLGRGVHYPIAMEGALKLKEISYIHAEAYAAGELKHGPLALVTREMPVIALAPRDALIEKLKSNLNEVRARGGELYVLADADAGIAADAGTHVLSLPAHAGLLSPIVYTVPLQLLAYYAALERNNDVDKPRNLAKSVTVE